MSFEQPNFEQPGEPTEESGGFDAAQEKQSDEHLNDSAQSEATMGAIPAEVAVEQTVGWKGDWKAGERPEGYVSISRRQIELESKGFRGSEFFGDDWLKKYNTLLIQAKSGELSENQLNDLLKYNKKLEVTLDQFEVESLIRPGSTIISKSGTRRIVEDWVQHDALPGGGNIVVTKIKGNEKPVSETITYRQLLDGKSAIASIEPRQ